MAGAKPPTAGPAVGHGFQLIGLKPRWWSRSPGCGSTAPTRLHHLAAHRLGPAGHGRRRDPRERDGFEAAGVQHVVAAPWRSDLDAWLCSMELLAAALDLG